jgi:hypothetical protein
MKKNEQLFIKGKEISLFSDKEKDYISLTDMARHKNEDDPRFVVQNWMKTRATLEFIGLWEIMNNRKFKRVEFDTFKNNSGSNSFVLTPRKWINNTDAIGIVSKAGRYGGTYAHSDIAFEFASWISAEFKLYLIKEFQRLKAKEGYKNNLEWNVKRILARVNYKVHTDAVRESLIPSCLNKSEINKVYSSEADILNMALFGMTAKQWRSKNKEGDVRDYANGIQLVCLAGLESLNAEFIRQGFNKKDRLRRLNEIAIIQMKSLSQVKNKERLVNCDF